MLEALLQLAEALPYMGKVNIGWIIIALMFLGQFVFEIKEG